MWLIIRSKQQFLIAAAAMGLAALTAVIAFGFAVRYTLREWDVLAEARGELAGDEAVRRGVGQANAALDGIAAERALLESSFANPDDLLPFIESIEALARRIGVRAELALTSGGNQPMDKYQINIEGEFRQVMLFLRTLESLPFLTTLGDTEISRTNPGVEASLVRLVVDAMLVLRPAPITSR